MFPITVASHNLFPNSTGGTTTYLTAAVIQAVLSLQLGQLTSAFTQQAIDKALVQKEVLREYDSKYVHPRLNVLKRDVATQTMDDHFEASVEVYTPVFNRQGFVTHVNPNYKHYTTAGAYSSTSGFSATPQIERQLQREQQQHSGGHLFNRSRQDDQADETPIKSEWSTKPRRFNSSRTTGIQTSADQERENERRQQRERAKRGSDAFSTIYPDIEADTTEHYGSNPQPLRMNNAIINTPSLPPTRRGLENQEFSPSPERTERIHDRTRADLGTPRRPTFIGGGNANIGMNGLVNMAVENSRALSPSKASSPIKSRARTSSYGASLGRGVFGTPKR